MPGSGSFQTLERLLSLRALDVFLLGTAISLHLLISGAHAPVVYIFYFLFFVIRIRGEFDTLQDIPSGVMMPSVASAIALVEVVSALDAQS